MCDLHDFEFYWKNDQLEIGSIFRRGIDTPLFPTAYDDMEMGGSDENPTLLDDEENKENSLSSTLASARPI